MGRTFFPPSATYLVGYRSRLFCPDSRICFVCSSRRFETGFVLAWLEEGIVVFFLRPRRKRRLLPIPRIPGFPGDSNTQIFARCSQSWRYFDALRLDFRLIRVLSGDRGCISSTAACDSLRIDRPRYLNIGLHLDFAVLQGLESIKFGTHKQTNMYPHPRSAR